MSTVDLIGLAGSVSLLAGWRLYLCVFATGLAMSVGWISVPEHFQALEVLTNPWVIGVAAIGLVAEFFADKIAWIDSAWDMLHTTMRPLGGALLALAIIDASDPVWQIVAFLLGGSAAFLSHGAKASTRAAVNSSPEPFSNLIVSFGEDIATGGLLIAAFSNPVIALVVFVVILFFATILLWLSTKLLRRLP